MQLSNISPILGAVINLLWRTSSCRWDYLKGLRILEGKEKNDIGMKTTWLLEVKYAYDKKAAVIKRY